MVHPLPIIFFGDQYEYCQKDRVITIANAVAFKASEDTSKIIQELRDRMNWFFEYKITHPGIIDWEERSEHISILRAIMELISNEETGDIFESEDDEDDF
ncbi:hypothetical protein NQ317_018886 [Molorchus minor]|uniref:RNA helicase C-terminal domain-containing protein n=1 Tax=Molorchus minor TaxID=1323400 RepID=A0ABQ9JIG0_9CUCU|nr:hypothetical protein NQ317_018886 [Molorchus minor]